MAETSTHRKNDQALDKIKGSAHYTRSLVDDPVAEERNSIQSTLKNLALQPHPEGGYFVETDRDPLRIPNPFQQEQPLPNATVIEPENSKSVRNAMTTIHYYLTPGSPIGHFHRNRARTVHTLHWGRGRYVIISAGEGSNKEMEPKAKIETFIVGRDIEKGEKVQWIVDGGKFKASFLLPDTDLVDGNKEDGESEKGLLISETVVPGFDFADHDFLTEEGLMELLEDEDARQLQWLLNKR